MQGTMIQKCLGTDDPVTAGNGARPELRRKLAMPAIWWQRSEDR